MNLYIKHIPDIKKVVLLLLLFKIVVTHFWVPTKINEKIQKRYIKKEIQKIIGARKRMLEYQKKKNQNWSRFNNTKG